MTTTKVKTSELVGPALDWAVAKAEGDDHWTSDRNPDWFAWRMRNWKPSTDWAQGGPLIEKYSVSPFRIDSETVGAEFEHSYMQFESQIIDAVGPTYLIAAMRAIVDYKLGDTVEIPTELMEVAN